MIETLGFTVVKDHIKFADEANFFGCVCIWPILKKCFQKFLSQAGIFVEINFQASLHLHIEDGILSDFVQRDQNFFEKC